MCSHIYLSVLKITLVCLKHIRTYMSRVFFVRVHDLSAGASRSIYNLVVIEFLHVCVGELTAKQIKSIAHLNIIYL